MQDTHSKSIGYLVWIFGFLGAHRFYYGKPVSGTIYFFTLGLFGIGWIIDLFLIPSMEKEAERRYEPGPYNYTISWLLLTYLGTLGIHRLYLGRIGTGILYMCTFGLLFLGVLWDFWHLNELVSERNRESRS
jgi:TM2 domain-containing membrane protein YozV